MNKEPKNRCNRRPPMATSLSLIALTPGAALASIEASTPAPGLFALIALGVIGAIAVGRSRQ